MSTPGLIVSFLLAFVACGDSDSNSYDPIGMPSLNGSFYSFEADRISRLPDVQNPHDDLYESDYAPADLVAQNNVNFSTDGKTVSLTTDPISGHEITGEDGSRSYELDLMAGGRFVIWIVENNYKAELTIYGSGIPIIQSERGALYTYENSTL